MFFWIGKKCGQFLKFLNIFINIICVYTKSKFCPRFQPFTWSFTILTVFLSKFLLQFIIQAYAIYKPAVDTYKNTKEKVTEKYTKDLDVLNAELEKVSKEINKKLQEREAVAEETRREEQVLKHKEEIKGIVYDIKRVDKVIGKEDKFLNRPEVLALDKALARRYQHKLSRHKRALENRLQRRKEVVKGKGHSLEVAPDEELSDGG